jgi:hypothetical protein
VKTHTGSNRARSVAIRLLGWYPRPWRVRYEAEMRALVDDMPVGWTQVGNLALTAAREWLSPRAVGWPARSSAERLWIIRFLTFLACAMGLNFLARIVAVRLVSSNVEIPESVETGFAIVSVVFALRVCTEGALRMKKILAGAPARPGWSFALREWELLLWAVVMWPLLVSFYVETPPTYLSPTMLQIRPYQHFLQIFVWTWLAFIASARTQRLLRIQSSHLKRGLRPLRLR